jgi:hypothetical protein
MDLMNFFKPTTYKIILFFLLFFLWGNYLIAYVGKINIFISPVDVFCGSVGDNLDNNSLSYLDEDVRNSLTDEEKWNKTKDNWIPVTLFCTLPLRAVYYYFVACLIVFIIYKIKKEKLKK